MPTEAPVAASPSAMAPTDVPVAEAANTQRQNQRSTPLQQPQQIATTQQNYVQQQQRHEHVPPATRRVVVNDFGPNDVLCGRGRATNNNPGNIKFRELVDTKKGDIKQQNMARRNQLPEILLKPGVLKTLLVSS